MRTNRYTDMTALTEPFVNKNSFGLLRHDTRLRRLRVLCGDITVNIWILRESIIYSQTYTKLKLE
ncbi:MAG: hypothetical protein BAJATHORv1_50005 [Candidatus Thorarchaeota archaeon]|nr:MAG: hypothetical protein BAJATHORv1_50005 [Candidatus Thorarchaeota archaeon]